MPDTELQVLRGQLAGANSHVGPLGSIASDVVNRSLRVHDGVTPGGTLQATLDSSGKVFYSQLPPPTVAKPTALPATELTNNTATLSSSSYSMQQGLESAHAYTRWQVSPSADFSSPLVDSLWSINLLSYSASGLQPGVTYHYRVAHRSVSGIESPWSDVVTFTTTSPSGEQMYTTPGNYTFTVPAGVTSLSAIAVGAGAGGDRSRAGGGGALGWKNNIPVTPGQQISVVVGAGGRPFVYSSSSGAVSAVYRVTSSSRGGFIGFATQNTNNYPTSPLPVGHEVTIMSTVYPPTHTFTGGVAEPTSGGYNLYLYTYYSSLNRYNMSTSYNTQYATNGGSSSLGALLTAAGGALAAGGSPAGHDGGGSGGTASTTAGGGAGGYTGNGGGYAAAATGGGGGYGTGADGGGGGVGLYGQGTSGTAGAGGSGGTAANGKNGGSFGGGGGAAAASGLTSAGAGGNGAVRIIWGSGRSFPNNAA